MFTNSQEFERLKTSRNSNFYSNTNKFISPRLTTLTSNNMQKTNAPNLRTTRTTSREENLKWKEIINLDLNHIMRTKDISQLERILDNLLHAKIKEKEISIVQEETLSKLFKLLQFLLDYFAHSNNQNEENFQAYENTYKELNDQNQDKEKILMDSKLSFDLIKKETRLKENLIKNYKELINEYKRGETAFSCKICVGKRFISHDNLRSHYERRHPGKFNQDESVSLNSLEIEKNRNQVLMTNLLLENQLKMEEEFNQLKGTVEKKADIGKEINSLILSFKESNKKSKSKDKNKYKDKEFKELSNFKRSFASTSKTLQKHLDMLNRQSQLKIEEMNKNIDIMKQTLMNEISKIPKKEGIIQVDENKEQILSERKERAKLMTMQTHSLLILPEVKIIEREVRSTEKEEDEKFIFEEKNIQVSPKTHIERKNDPTEKSIEVQKSIKLIKNPDYEKMIEDFYQEFSNREDNYYNGKISMDKIYQIKNVEEAKENTEEYLNNKMKNKFEKFNKNKDFELEDLRKTGKKEIVNIISEIQQKTQQKSEKNEFYKIFMNKLVTDLNLGKYLNKEIEDLKNEEQSNIKDKETVIEKKSVNKPIKLTTNSKLKRLMDDDFEFGSN